MTATKAKTARKMKTVKPVIGLTYDQLKALKPCRDSMERVAGLMGGAESWNGRLIDAKAAREAGATFDDLVWAASALARSPATG